MLECSTGRTALNNNMLWCSHSGTGAEFNFKGRYASVTIAGDSTSLNKYDPNNQARIAIYVNGERIVDDMIDEPEKTYNIINNNVSDNYNVKIVKLSESLSSGFAIKEIKLDGTPEPVRKNGLIEFIGDSITCGYGIDDENKDHSYSTTTEDITKTYAFKTAEALGYGYSMVSFSGHGVLSGYTSEKINSEMTVPKYYNKIGHSNYSLLNGKNPDEIEWDFSKKPDIIVLNLGTNDSSYCQNDSEKQSDFKIEYINFLKQIREKNPDSKIVCTMGIMGGTLFPVIESAVSDYKSESGDDKVYTMEFDIQSFSDGVCADYHPSEKTNTKASEKLVKFLKNII